MKKSSFALPDMSPMFSVWGYETSPPLNTEKKNWPGTTDENLKDESPLLYHMFTYSNKVDAYNEGGGIDI